MGGRSVPLVPASARSSLDVCECHATLCLSLLLSLLCVDDPEQRREKSRKMPSCSGSESKDSWMLSITISGLDDGLGPELVSWASTLEDAEESDTREPVQCVSSPGEGSGRMQGEGCFGSRGWGPAGLSACLDRGSLLEVTVSAQRTVRFYSWSCTLICMGEQHGGRLKNNI